MIKPSLTILLASPRGFCAGVDRAIHTVEEALRQYGRPVFVRHEIVHNRYVVRALEAKGAIFVDELDEVPADRPVVFSAHGVPKSVPAAAAARGMFYLDATCPLVTKVHHEAARHVVDRRRIILIGHAGHPEVVGTLGQVPEGSMLLVETVAQAEALDPSQIDDLAYITQTTLSVDDTAEIVGVLRRRFPHIEGPRKEDICYATTNRQQAIKAIAGDCDALLVIGSPNSSNSKRLVEVALRAGCARALLVQQADDFEWEWLAGVRRLGLSAGASAPEILVEELIALCRDRFEVTIEEVLVTRETVTFKLPGALAAAARPISAPDAVDL